MDWIHKLLNIICPILAIIIILVFLPPFLIYKLLNYSIKALLPAGNLAGKVVLITGASSGIGEHLAYEYAKRGARLALAARREDRLRSVAAKSAAMGSPDVIVVRADVSKIEDCKRLVEETMNHFGQLDHLVNNAGVTQVGLFEDSTEFSTLRSVMDVNFWGSVYCTQFAIPHLRNSKGKIVVLSSVATWLAAPRLGVYNASKAAQLCFFDTLKAEFGSDIGITIVSPGFIVSEITADEFWSQTRVEGFPIPVQSATSCAKAILKSTCRGDMYLTEPSWWSVGFLFKVIFPQLVNKCIHFMLVKRPWTNSNKDA